MKQLIINTIIKIRYICALRFTTNRKVFLSGGRTPHQICKDTNNPFWV